MRTRLKKAFLWILALGIVCYMFIPLVMVATTRENLKRHVSNIIIPKTVLSSHPATKSYKYETIMPSQPAIASYKYSSFKNLSSTNCSKLFEGDVKSLNYTKSVSYHMKTDQEIYKEAQDCQTFLKQGGYLDHVITESELNFPIAYSILLYKDVAQMVLLLKAIYRSHNIYCIHVDGFSDTSVHLTTKAVKDCFQNVFIVSKTEKVIYAGFTRLQADLNCMSDALSSHKKVQWKYFINLPSQEFPLKTNAEIVKILKIYNGSNDIEGITGRRMLARRYIYKHVYQEINGRLELKPTNMKNPPPPHNITVVKGSAYGIFSRAFVEFVIRDKRALDFMDWCKAVSSPDEYFWATLHHNEILKPPGGYSGPPDKKPWLATYAAWYPDMCAGRYMRSICVFSEGDLPLLASRRELFANKFVLSENPVVLMCLEEWLHNKSSSELPFDAYYYRNLPFITH